MSEKVRGGYTPPVFIELIAVTNSEEIVSANDGDDAILMIEDKWDTKIKPGDDLIRLKISNIEQIRRHEFYLSVSATVRRLITIEDGLISSKLSELLKEIQLFESEYKGSVFINRYWLGSEKK